MLYVLINLFSNLTFCNSDNRFACELGTVYVCGVILWSDCSRLRYALPTIWVIEPAMALADFSSRQI